MLWNIKRQHGRQTLPYLSVSDKETWTHTSVTKNRELSKVCETIAERQRRYPFGFAPQKINASIKWTSWNLRFWYWKMSEEMAGIYLGIYVIIGIFSFVVFNDQLCLRIIDFGSSSSSKGSFVLQAKLFDLMTLLCFINNIIWAGSNLLSNCER